MYKIPQRFDHHNINTKVCLFNELLVERFLDTKDFLTVVDTVQPEIKFYCDISKLCGITLSKLYKIPAPTSHKSRASARPNRKAFVRGSSSIVEVILNRHMGHTAHLKLGAGMYNILKQLFYISNR